MKKTIYKLLFAALFGLCLSGWLLACPRIVARADELNVPTNTAIPLWSATPTFGPSPTDGPSPTPTASPTPTPSKTPRPTRTPTATHDPSQPYPYPAPPGDYHPAYPSPVEVFSFQATSEYDTFKSALKVIIAIVILILVGVGVYILRKEDSANDR